MPGRIMVIACTRPKTQRREHPNSPSPTRNLERCNGTKIPRTPLIPRCYLRPKTPKNYENARKLTHEGWTAMPTCWGSLTPQRWALNVQRLVLRATQILESAELVAATALRTSSCPDCGGSRRGTDDLHAVIEMLRSPNCGMTKEEAGRSWLSRTAPAIPHPNHPGLA